MLRRTRALIRTAVGPMGKVAVASLAVAWGVKVLQDVASELIATTEQANADTAKLREEGQVWADLIDQSVTRYGQLSESIARAEAILTAREEELRGMTPDSAYTVADMEADGDDS